MQPAQLNKRSDFALAPFRQADDGKALWQLLTTVLPLALLWASLPWLCQSQGIQTLLIVPVLVLLVLFHGRSLGLIHDCGHGSLFHSRAINRIVGFLLCSISGIPLHPWAFPQHDGFRSLAFHRSHHRTRSHSFHHLHNGNWDRYRGPAPLLTVQQFRQLSPRRQKLYCLSRHPLMLFPGGFFYLVVRSRLQLIQGLWQWIHAMWEAIRTDGFTALSSIGRRTLAFESDHWSSTNEFLDLLANTLCVIGVWWLMACWLGSGLFWISYSLVMSCAGALLIGIFYVQHIFPEAYAHGNQNWSYFKGALKGSSNLVLPRVLNWFTVDIAFHTIHHLCERIPNYRLRECHRANQHLLADCTYLRLRDLPQCFQLILWDSVAQKLVSINELE